MPSTTNPDGSVTYSITVPAPITVTRDAAGVYSAAGQVFAIGTDPKTDQDWQQLAAGSIAIIDEHAATVEATRLAARDALASALYTSDTQANPGAGPWSVLTDDARQPYRDRADALGPLGVTAVIQ